jgi:hypothetical protein
VAREVYIVDGIRNTASYYDANKPHIDRFLRSFLRGHDKDYRKYCKEQRKEKKLAYARSRYSEKKRKEKRIINNYLADSVLTPKDLPKEVRLCIVAFYELKRLRNKKT